MGQGNKKLSKRDPEANALGYREAGFLPEGLLNYLALLGWAIAGRPRHLHARGDGRRRSTSATSTPTPRAST